MINKINIKGLLPDFQSISLSIETNDQLSAIFVSALLLTFSFFVIWTLIVCFASSRRSKWLLKILKKQTTSTVVLNRQDLIEQAEKRKGLEGHLWLEFDETLLEVEQNGEVSLLNTLDASHFFNNSTLAPGITESRMLAAVPGFLTALGVIGTFIGLQLGLSELNIGNDVSVTEMKTGLAHVIGGAKVAFMTSVWGVALSVIFNFFEKLLAGGIRKRVHKLQNAIDKIFPRLSAEFQLERIAVDGKQSRESLQGLAEKIGDKMQDSLVQVTAGIQAGLEASLEKIMAPAINKLVDETSDGNQKVMDSLIGSFLDKFGEVGGQQKHAMESASHKINESLNSLSTSMEIFLSKLDQNQNNSAEREKELIDTISDQVSLLVNQSTEQGKVLTEYVENQLNSLSGEFQDREEKSAEREKELIGTISNQVSLLVNQSTEQGKVLTEYVENQLSSLTDKFQDREEKSIKREEASQSLFVKQSTEVKEATETLLSRVEDGLNSQFTASGAILEQGKSIQAGVEESIRANIEASTSMKTSASELKSAATEMNNFGSLISSAGSKLSGTIAEAVISTTDLAHQNKNTSDLIKEYRQQLIDDRAQFSEVGDRLQSLVNSADTVFGKMSDHQRTFLRELEQNVSALAGQMTNLLDDYAKRANSQTTEHLDLWARHTTNYAEQMTGAYKALSNVVEDIEDKLGH